eukprot:TRINITY_DN69736_c0_g1_i1.p1 TRINITY_DN69736_c0_g1~~TRINITY_DN69736_c0_g1_i1.p1  ORF type:complete len:255 (+),score=43.70 TRINITY_DN69736_c0_g1_i1:104-766(+)
MTIVSDKVREAFRTWDAEGQGLIGKGQLVRIIQKLTPAAQKDLEAMFAAAGAELGNRVKYEEFIAWLWIDCEDEETLKEAMRERGLWESYMLSARIKAASIHPEDRVNRYFDQVHQMLSSEEYTQHVKDTMFRMTTKDTDGRVTFEDAKLHIAKSLSCAADLVHAPKPTSQEVRDAFDAHDTLTEGRGRMGVQEFINLSRYLQVRVAEAVLPLSKVITDP